MKIKFNNNECYIESDLKSTKRGIVIGFSNEGVFRYSYKHPKLIITPKDGSDFHEKLEVTLFDNEMSILNTKTDEVFKLKRIH